MKLFLITVLSLFSVSTFAAVGSCTSAREDNSASVCLQVDTAMPEVMESIKSGCGVDSNWADVACKAGAVGSCENANPVGTFTVAYY